MRQHGLDQTGAGRHLGALMAGLGLVTLLIVSCPAMAESDSGVIKGKVYEAHHGRGLARANIVVVGTGRGAASDPHGDFVIDRIEPGQYRLKASFVGYESVEKTVTVSPGTETSVEFSLREDFFQAEQVVVTATRTPKILEDLPVVTEIVTRQEIEEKGAEDLSEILEDRPGIAIETGTTGDKFLYMNGVDSKRILLLRDGLPIAGRLNNRIQLDLLDADPIDRIEITKGPGSALYGSDAMGGVINVISGGYPANLEVKANSRVGSEDLFSGGLSLSGQKEKIGFAVRGDYYRKGADKSSAEIEIKDTRATTVSGKVRAGQEALGTVEVKAEYRKDDQESETMYTGGTNDARLEVENLSTSLGWSKSSSKTSELEVAAYYSDNDRTYKTMPQGSPEPASVDVTTDVIAGVKSDFSFAPHEMLGFDVGIDVSNNAYDNPRLTAEESRTQLGPFAQIEVKPSEDITLIGGARYDKISDLDGHISPRASMLYSGLPNLKLRASWGLGFRAPSFIELYSDFLIPIPGMPIRVAGNPDLEPETSNGGSAGIEYSWSDLLVVSANYFHNTFKNMIVDYKPDPEEALYSYLNVESATFRTLELQTGIYFSTALTAALAYNFTDVKQDADGVAISRISPHTASLRLDYRPLRRLRVSMRGQYFGKRDILVISGHGGDISTETRDAYNLVDLTLSYRVSDDLALRLGSTNLADYTDEDYGPWGGRRFFFSIDAGFQQ